MIDAATAKDGGFDVGDPIGVSASGPIEQFRIAGIAKYGSVDSLGGATIAVFDLPTAQRVLRKDGYDSISVAARKGTSVERAARGRSAASCRRARRSSPRRRVRRRTRRR